MTLRIQSDDKGVAFSVKVVPGSSRTRIAGLYETALKVNLAAPPEKGKANRELIKLLAQVLGCPKNQVSITAGTSNPRKEIYIAGVTESQLLSVLGEYLS